MRRILTYCALIVGLIVLAAALGFFAIFGTGPGRAFLITQAEPRIAAALGGEVEIGRLEGAPPGSLVLTDIRLSENGEPWLTVDRAELNWRPLALVGRDIIADTIVIDGAFLSGQPPERPKTEKGPEPIRIGLPQNLPDIVVGDITITNFRSDIGPAPSRVDGRGSLNMGGRQFTADLSLMSSGEKDTVDARIRLDPRADQAVIDVAITSQADGLITTFANLGGPLFIEAKGDGPVDEFHVDLTAASDAYGQISGVIRSDLTSAGSLATQLTFVPGAEFSGIEEFGDTVSLEAKLEQGHETGVVNVTELTAGIGAFSGDFKWVNRRDRIAKLSVNGELEFSNGYRPDIQSYIGEKLALHSSLERQRDAYSFVAYLESDRARIAVDDGKTDLSKTVSGAVNAMLAARDDAPPPLNFGSTAAGPFVFVAGETVRADNFTLTIGDQSTIRGDIRYAFESGTLAYDGDINLSVQVVEGLIPSIRPDGRTSGALNFEGALDNFAVEAEFTTPELRINDNAAPALAIQAALTGLPAAPVGSISARSRYGGAGNFDADIETESSGRISIPVLKYESGNFLLSGRGGYLPTTRIIDINLSYSGKAGAEPWPGVQLVGDIALNGRLAGGGASSDFAANSRSLRINGAQISGVEISATGPPGAVGVNLTGDRLWFGRERAVADFDAKATADLREPIQIDIQRLDAIVDNIETTLTSPTKIVLGDGVSVKNLRLDWGREGSIALDGEFDRERWRAEAALKDFNIPETDGRLTLNADIDTNRDTPARGEFSLRSLLTNSNEAALAGAFVWNGTHIALTSEKDAGAVDMNLRLPARLSRTPEISIQTDGEMDGHIHYEGEIKIIAAYLPPALQSFEGKLDASATVAGAYDEPRINGRAELTDGAYTEPRSGFSLAGVHTEASASVTPGGTRIEFTGGARGGAQSSADTITLSGDVALGDNASLDLTVSLEDAEFAAGPISSTRASGVVEVRGAPGAATVNGAIEVKELNAQVVSPETTGLEPIEVVNAGTAANERSAEATPQPGYEFTLKIAADDRIFIRGRGLESEWRADVEANSDRGEPIVTGAVTLRRGWLDFSGRRFDPGSSDW